ncbi:MAG: ATP-binding protein [Lachnospiraceae bacterium]|nr:ATP-binding protein [Lachnospiraceae bacterium]
MDGFINSVLFSIVNGISCEAYFGTIAEKRVWKQKWVGGMTVLAFGAGFMIISYTPVPPYIFQPVRLAVVVAVAAQLYFRIKPLHNLLFSILFCSIYWMETMLAASLIFMLPQAQAGAMEKKTESIVAGVHLCLMLAFHYRYKKSARKLLGVKWERFGIFPIISLIVVMAVTMLPWDRGSAVENHVRLTVNLGVIAISLCAFYLTGNLLEKDMEMQGIRLLHERTKNQMNMYHNMQKNYEQQRKYLHDYKNQLACIQGMLEEGRTKEALAYISKLTGGLKKSADHINANHTAVNVVLNQKYQEAGDRGIAMAIAVNDLSGLTVSEEEIVTLLVNLIDNAMEACGKLDKNKIIQFKMMLEEGELILSVRNPVKEPVRIKDGRVATSKEDAGNHGIGLLNVEAVIKKNAGTSVIRCEDGWFSFSAMIPIPA